MATTTTIPGYIDLTEAAKIIGVSHSQVWRYIDDGLINALNIGGTYLVKRRDAANFVRPPRGNPAFRQRSEGKKERR